VAYWAALANPHDAADDAAARMTADFARPVCVLGMGFRESTGEGRKYYAAHK
jgi:hypothetical protein